MGKRPRAAQAIAIGKRIRDLRKAKKMTQVDLAVAIGIERGTVAGIEVGASHPGRITLIALATLFGVSLDYLQNGTALPGDHVALDPAQEEKEAIFLRLLRRLRDDQREVVAMLMRSLLNEPEATSGRHNASPSVNIP